MDRARVGRFKDVLADSRGAGQGRIAGCQDLRVRLRECLVMLLKRCSQDLAKVFWLDLNFGSRATCNVGDHQTCFVDGWDHGSHNLTRAQIEVLAHHRPRTRIGRIVPTPSAHEPEHVPNFVRDNLWIFPNFGTRPTPVLCRFRNRRICLSGR